MRKHPHLNPIFPTTFSISNNTSNIQPEHSGNNPFPTNTLINVHILVRSIFIVFFKRSRKQEQEQKRKKRQCCQNEEQYQHYRRKEHFHNHLSSSSNNDPANNNENGKNASKRYIFNMFTITRTIHIPNTSIRFLRI